MKKLKVLIIAFIGLSIFACGEKKQQNNEENIATKNVIEVIDFHSTHRCVTCESIELNAKYTLETYFAEELKGGKITFQVVNVDEEENYKMAEKFEATGTALFINVVKEGKEERIDLTEFAFTNGRDTETFSEELKIKIEEQLAKM